MDDGSQEAVIKFGPKDHQVLRPDVAELMLTMLFDRNPAQFGALLAETMTGEKPRAGRGKS